MPINLPRVRAHQIRLYNATQMGLKRAHGPPRCLGQPGDTRTGPDLQQSLARLQWCNFKSRNLHDAPSMIPSVPRVAYQPVR